MGIYTTARYGFELPDGDEPLNVSDDDLRAFGDAVDAIIATGYAGALGDRPAAGKLGRFWWGTDTGRLYLDTVSTWVAIGPGVLLDASVTFAKLADAAVTGAKLKNFGDPVTALPGGPSEGDPCVFQTGDED